MKTRKLRPSEIDFMVAAFRICRRDIEELKGINSCEVIDMYDHRLGGLIFDRSDRACRLPYGRVFEVEFEDSDSIAVNVVLTVDNDGYLFELDNIKFGESPVHCLSTKNLVQKMSGNDVVSFFIP